MIKDLADFTYDRKVLIGRPNLTLKDLICKNITCNKKDKFKKYKDDMYICECGYIVNGDVFIEESHKVKLYCQKGKCIFGKEKMNRDCLKCEFIGEK